jgi:hypothetical protein
MAKKPKKAKLSIKAPSQPSLATTAKNEDEYQVRDDADKIRNYARLTQDKDRHSKALGHIENEHRAMRDIISGESMERPNTDSDTHTIQPRSMARSGRKKSARAPRSSGRR